MGNNVPETVGDAKIISDGIAATHCEKQGKLAESGKYYQNIWETAQRQDKISVFTFGFLVEYLVWLQNDGNYQRMQRVAVYLQEMLEEERIDAESINKNEQLFLASYQKLITLLCFILRLNGHDDAIEPILTAFISAGLVSSNVGNDETLAIYGAYLSTLHERKKKCSMWKQFKIGKFLHAFEKRPDFDKLSPWLRSNFYGTCYYLRYMKNPHKAEKYLEQMSRILLYEAFPEQDRQPYLSNMIAVICEYKERGQMQKVSDCSEHLFRRLMEYYSVSEYYTDNEKLDSYLGSCKVGFQVAYMALREISPAWKRMEYSMNFKNILSSAIRLRNLLGEKESRLNYFTMEDLTDRLPENTAIIDYFYIEPQIYETKELTYDSSEIHYLLEAFVLAKRDNKVCFSHYELTDALELNRMLHTYRERLEQEGGKVNALARKIYSQLLAPIEADLKSIAHLWVCPDGEICNIPMEMLIGTQNDWEYADIVYWHSLRDIFEEWEDALGDSQRVCLVGEPSFHIKEKRRNQEGAEKQRASQEEFVPLLYSGYEVKKIAGLLGGGCFMRQRATKYVIEPGYHILHIATHGISMLGEERVWHNSKLAFAGISDFTESGRRDRTYGNGSLSAEEISRMNMTGTELVVLSACYSGNSIFSRLRQQTGLHVAFGAAGVKYIISALWKVDDLSTAVLMGYFYRNVLEGHMIPKALKMAKDKLSSTTVTELIEIVKGDYQILGDAYHDLAEQLESLPEDYCMYRSAFYWAGFVCYEFLN